VTRLLAALTLLLPALALADVDPRFSKLRDSAEPLGGLGGFLDKFIGECTGLFTDPQCKANSEAFRKHYQGKRMYMIITEDVATMVAPGTYTPRSGDYTIHITPFFPGSKYALSHGAPKKTDANGNPIMQLLSVSGSLPPGWNAQMFARLFSTRGIRAQVIFKPKSIWTLPKPNGDKVFGVNAEVEAILLTEGRTGEQLGLWIHGKDLPARK
jgi:hypothetical protein